MDDKRKVPALAAGFAPVDQTRARAPMRQRLREPWLWVFLLGGGLLAALYLATIGSDPPGLYDDEANIGYNAWTIAHYGVDQYGNHFPLFFVAFGDYKGPIPTYLVAPLTWVIANGSALVRLPSVLAGIAIFLVAGRLAYRLTGSKSVAALTMILTALQPWVFLQSHTTMEGNIFMVLCLLVAVWCIAEARISATPGRWWTAAGAALAVGVFTYTVARPLMLVVAIIAAAVFARHGRRQMIRFLFPVAIAYVVVGVWSIAYPDTLFARFQAVGLFADHPSWGTALLRFASNYASYFSPDFLLLKGDGNYRQTTGFGGVLLAATVALMLAGLVRLITRRHEPMSRFVFLGVVVAPLPAALSLAAPHALRGAGLIPFLTVLMIEGLGWGRRLLRERRKVAAAFAAALVISALPFFADFFIAYPARAATAFEAGEGTGLRLAYSFAQQANSSLFLSASLNQPVAQLMYEVDAPPPQQEFVRRARITVVGVRPQFDAIRSGDLIVLGTADVPPQRLLLRFVVRDGRILEAPVGPSSDDLLRVYSAQ
jgi:4-amino-4-deoxy-L-arabinose transferase-like glycosyltransferase